MLVVIDNAGQSQDHTPSRALQLPLLLILTSSVMAELPQPLTHIEKEKWGTLGTSSAAAH